MPPLKKRNFRHSQRLCLKLRMHCTHAFARELLFNFSVNSLILSVAS